MSEIEQKQESASIQRSGFSGMSITAFILSLFGFLLALPAVAGLILGIVSLVRSNRDTRRRGLAIAAVVVSSLWILIFGVVLLNGSDGFEGKRVDVASVQERLDKAEDVNGPAPSPSRIESRATTAVDDSTSANASGSGDFITRMAQSLFSDLDAQEQFSACNSYRANGVQYASWELATFMTLPSRMSSPISDSDRDLLILAMAKVLVDSCK